MRENTDQNNSEYGDFLRRNGLTKVLQMLRECHAEHLFGIVLGIPQDIFWNLLRQCKKVF